MSAAALTIRPTIDGWMVGLTNGVELIRYRGVGSRWLAVRYLRRYARAAGIATQ
jgi:hypothetical protein